MSRRAKIFAALILPLMPLPVQADNWILVEANVFPSGCTSMAACLDTTTTEIRNLMAMDSKETDAFLNILSDLAEIEDVPKVETTANIDDFPLADIIPRIQILDVAAKPDVLKGIPGIYFDASRVAGEDAAASFIVDFTQMLRNAGIPVLTEEDALALPGAARMSVNMSLTRDNAGCILPFRTSLSLKEEVVLVRDPSIKIETTTWSVSIAENFANSNYVATTALRDAALKFIEDYNTANAS